ncbi:hypothetical protein LTR16_011805, partial [Cryomyces antarcticus]
EQDGPESRLRPRWQPQHGCHRHRLDRHWLWLDRLGHWPDWFPQHRLRFDRQSRHRLWPDGHRLWLDRFSHHHRWPPRLQLDEQGGPP